ncbi:hypothetical protein NC653_037157 [Populus alba x Populus x berolinensis]|uniref:Uncharacterized protein n=1 Tax=Populus alba x Populus x berolinensis TaxID=444605 RepID=A0AAD6LLL6_9ROSI|nr:hypothetical protein NC653_037157 [Populus alba x Populus x berolinensis]
MNFWRHLSEQKQHRFSSIRQTHHASPPIKDCGTYLCTLSTKKLGPDMAVADAICEYFGSFLTLKCFKLVDEDIKVTDDGANYHDEAASSQLIQVPRNENIIEKSIVKLKKTSTDVLQGTQLLAY